MLILTKSKLFFNSLYNLCNVLRLFIAISIDLVSISSINLNFFLFFFNFTSKNNYKY
jgi:hypothetical protein